MSYHYRCSKCKARRALRHILAWYIRKPRCRQCGHNHFYYDKSYLQGRVARECRCEGLPYPHRKGHINRAIGACQHADPQRASILRGWWPAADGIGTWVAGEYTPF